MYKHKLYKITNKTSLHVGSGDTNFDLIDKQIQRDVITNYPTIHASSLKGALKEYCDFKHDKNESENFMAHIFGDENNSGKVRFLEAHLLSVPFRSDLRPYYNCTSPKAMAQLVDFIETFSLIFENVDALKKVAEYKESNILVKEGTPIIEDENAKESTAFDFDVLENILGENVAIVPDKTFEGLLKDLPVVARNSLENGESKNLWYEEVLPRESKLFTVISEPTYLNDLDEKKLNNAFNRFGEYLTSDDTIHIGANASIGYGVTVFEEL